jgi:hypothetical protein
MPVPPPVMTAIFPAKSFMGSAAPSLIFLDLIGASGFEPIHPSKQSPSETAPRSPTFLLTRRFQCQWRAGDAAHLWLL